MSFQYGAPPSGAFYFGAGDIGSGGTPSVLVAVAVVDAGEDLVSIIATAELTPTVTVTVIAQDDPVDDLVSIVGFAVARDTTLPPPAPIFYLTHLWEDIARDITMWVPDCPEFTLVRAIRYEARQFYRDTRAWRAERVLLATTVAGQASYLVSTPDGAELVGLPAIWIDDEEVIETPDGGHDDTLSVGVAGASVIQLSSPALSTGHRIVATVAYAPTESAPGITEDMHRLHGQAIERAAIARLQSMAGKAWSDPRGAVDARQDANRLALKAGTAAGPRSSRAALRVTPA